MKDWDAKSESLTSELCQKAIDNIINAEPPGPPVHLVSPDRYRKLKYFVGEIFKQYPTFMSTDPYSIEIKAHELGIVFPMGKETT